jgi:hypothetical protein
MEHQSMFLAHHRLFWGSLPLTPLVGSDVFGDLILTPEFQRLRDVGRMTPLSYIFAPFSSITFYDSAIRMLLMTSRWIHLLERNNKVTFPVDEVITVQLAALMFYIGKRSWLYAVSGQSTDTHALSSLNIFTSIVQTNAHIETCLRENYNFTLSTHSTKLFSLINGTYTSHPLGTLINNQKTMIDVKNFELLSACNVYWEQTNSHCQVFTADNVDALFAGGLIVGFPNELTRSSLSPGYSYDPLGNDTQGSTQYVVAQSGLVGALVYKFFECCAAYKHVLALHSAVHAAQIMRLKLTRILTEQQTAIQNDGDFNVHAYPYLRNRLETHDLFSLLDEEFVTSVTKENINVVGMKMVTDLMRDDKQLRASDMIISACCFVDADVFVQSVKQVCRWDMLAYQHTNKVVISVFDVQIPSLMNMYAGVVRVFTTREQQRADEMEDVWDAIL